MKIVVNYLNSVFHIEVKTKSNDKFLNFVFQFIKNTEWCFGYTDCFYHIWKFLSNVPKHENLYTLLYRSFRTYRDFKIFDAEIDYLKPILKKSVSYLQTCSFECYFIVFTKHCCSERSKKDVFINWPSLGRTSFQTQNKLQTLFIKKATFCFPKIVLRHLKRSKAFDHPGEIASVTFRPSVQI